VVAYDQATGFGLLQALAPLGAEPVPLGNAGAASTEEPLLIASGTGRRLLSIAQLVSRRGYSGYWEYHIEGALFTAPARPDHSGAGLFDADGRLLGIGSLIVANALGQGQPDLEGNMFVPIDLLKPILVALVRDGRRPGPIRPWLGVAADEDHGRLMVVRVSPDGPADRAGLHAGDIILGVGGQNVRSQEEFYRKVWSRTAGAIISLRVLQGVDLHEVKIRSIDRVEYFRRKPSY